MIFIENIKYWGNRSNGKIVEVKKMQNIIRKKLQIVFLSKYPTGYSFSEIKITRRKIEKYEITVEQAAPRMPQVGIVR